MSESQINKAEIEATEIKIEKEKGVRGVASVQGEVARVVTKTSFHLQTRHWYFGWRHQ